MYSNRSRKYVLFVLFFCASLLLVQCSMPQVPFLQGTTITPDADIQVPVSEDAEKKSEITFTVSIPLLPATEQIYLDVLDEVTGLALNSKRFPMEKTGDNQFSVTIPFKAGTLVKYRYARDGVPVAIEHNTSGAQVRYRLFSVKNTSEIFDIVAAWSDSPYSGETGRIQGQVTDVSNNPLPDIMIAAGGVTSLSSSDGSFLLEGLPAGTHNLVAYSINGKYVPFQQGALVAANSTTPAPLQLPPTHDVNITFVLSVPEESIKDIPIKIIGNIYSLGNTFANLQGGGSVLASRAPSLSLLPDGRYAITLSLPAGLDLRYKYTLGDGFWNTEHRTDGSFRIRQLIVPTTDQIVEDQIESWTSGDTESVWFHVKVPADTPATDVISIQFNPYTWTEPISMWPAGNNEWYYVLQSPFHLLSNISYRYCRNEQCGIADPAAVDGSLEQFQFSTSDLPSSIDDEILHWSWLNMEEEQIRIVGKDVNPRGTDFIAAIELLADYHPSWQPYYSNTFQSIKDIGANWVFLTPTWHYSSKNPPVLEAVPGKDALWADLSQITLSAQEKGLNIAMYPQSKALGDQEAWWSSADRDAGWWNSWFDRYRTFLLNYADFAEQNQIGILVLGEPGMLPGIMNGLLPDGEPSNVVADAEQRWAEIISEIRSRYHGKLVFAISDLKDLDVSPEFLAQFDQFYVTANYPLTMNGEDIATLYQSVADVIDQNILPLWETHQKPVILGIDYPSVDGASQGCIVNGEECLEFNVLDQPFINPINVALDLDIQMNIYEAFVSEINEREWIEGFVSQSYYPPLELQDLSSSIRGKSASAVLWYWYPNFILPGE